MRRRALGRALVGLLTAGSMLYLGGLLAWAVCRWAWGDRWWWLFALNAFAPYLFFPLALIALVAMARRSRALALACACGALLGVVTVGAGFPLGVPRAEPAGPAITVLTYNTFGHSQCAACAIATIRAADADLVALQELTPAIAEAIERELAEAYPYRVLAPDPGVIGMGTISRYPLRATGEALPGTWYIVPQILTLDFMGREVTVLNAHPAATPIAPGPRMERSVRDREAQARSIADFAVVRSGPLLAPGDYNTTERNVAYDILTGPLRDAWREAGRGPGHTFPGGEQYPLPWLVRIDYILHSSHWRAVEARVLPWDGVSDHRAVFARLVLR